MRRYGLEPMVVINSGDALPDLVIVLLARWLWRYRSELAPLYLATVTMLAAWVLHATHPGWWAAVLAAATVAAGGWRSSAEGSAWPHSPSCPRARRPRPCSDSNNLDKV